MQEKTQRLRLMVREALAEYHSGIVNGEEPTFPQWAKDWQGVLDTLDETTRQNAALAEDYKGLEANATVNATNPKRYGLGIERSGGIGQPAIVEMEHGEYVQARFYDACVAHNEMLVERLKMAEAKAAQPSVDHDKLRADGFTAGFICAGGDADEAKRQAPQYVSCVNAK